jgi:hypothetical protein
MRIFISLVGLIGIAFALIIAGPFTVHATNTTQIVSRQFAVPATKGFSYKDFRSSPESSVKVLQR